MQALSAVDGEYEIWRQIVVSNQPKWKFVQPNAFLNGDGTVELREHEASNVGLFGRFSNGMFNRNPTGLVLMTHIGRTRGSPSLALRYDTCVELQTLSHSRPVLQYMYSMCKPIGTHFHHCPSDRCRNTSQ